MRSLEGDRSDVAARLCRCATGKRISLHELKYVENDARLTQKMLKVGNNRAENSS